jgi:hypothetical protein
LNSITFPLFKNDKGKVAELWQQSWI